MDMCGRFALGIPKQRLEEHFGCEFPETGPRYNIAPGQDILVVGENESGRHAAPFRWGLVPHWADAPSTKYRMINARCESAASKPAFRDAFSRRRCLVPAQGFFEWKREGESKTPWFISLKTGEPMALGGIWELWRRGDEQLYSCAVMTCQPNELVAKLHDRMPVIIEPTDYGRWLDPGLSDTSEIAALCRPLPAGLLAAHPVGSKVNSPRNDDASIIEPAH